MRGVRREQFEGRSGLRANIAPAVGAAAIGAAGALLSGIGGGDSTNNKDVAKIQSKDKRMEILIDLLREEARRQMSNRMADATVPLVQDAARYALDPTSGPFNPIMARSRQETFATQRPDGTQGVSLTPGGQDLSPQQLQELQPDFAKFQAIRGHAEQLTSGLVASNFQQESILPAVDQLSPLRNGLTDPSSPDHDQNKQYLRQLGAGESFNTPARDPNAPWTPPPAPGQAPGPAPAGPAQVQGGDPATIARQRAEARIQRMIQQQGGQPHALSFRGGV